MKFIWLYGNVILGHIMGHTHHKNLFCDWGNENISFHNICSLIIIPLHLQASNNHKFCKHIWRTHFKIVFKLWIKERSVPQSKNPFCKIMVSGPLDFTYCLIVWNLCAFFYFKVVQKYPNSLNWLLSSTIIHPNTSGHNLSMDYFHPIFMIKSIC